MQGLHPRRSTNSAFTLIELLVVIAIIAILAAILFPVFAQAREKARQTSCLSNTKQLGIAVYQYFQDFDEVAPNGNYKSGAPGGWAGQIYSYVKSAQVYRCPSDIIDPRKGENPSSYAYNSNFSIGGNGVCTGTVYALGSSTPITNQCSQAVGMTDMTSPSKTVMFFEVEGNTGIDVTSYWEGPYTGTNYNSSPSGNGNVNYYSPFGGGSISTCPAPAGLTLKYATGYMGNRNVTTSPNVTCLYSGPTGRHSGGSNFIMGDTHAKWFMGTQVSSGKNAANESATQIAGQSSAAGTSGMMPTQPGSTTLVAPSITFSVR